MHFKLVRSATPAPLFTTQSIRASDSDHHALRLSQPPLTIQDGPATGNRMKTLNVAHGHAFEKLENDNCFFGNTAMQDMPITLDTTKRIYKSLIPFLFCTIFRYLWDFLNISKSKKYLYIFVRWPS